MRSHYDDFAAGETNKLSSSFATTNYNNNSVSLNNNNNNSNSNNNNSNGAIPYHARENSLPFSYGQISKTSTPLRPTHTNATLSSSSLTSTVSRRSHTALGLDYGYGKTTNNQNSVLNGSGGGGVGGVKDVNFNLLTHNDRDRERNNFYAGLNSDKYLNETCSQTVKYNNQSYNNNNCNNNNSGLNNSFNNLIKTVDETDASMIKSQPRLTSPLLVRKTLSNGSNNNSRSPTRSTTNTIANTYHYNFGNGNNSNNSNKNGSFIGDNNFDKFGVNGNINSNNDNYGHKTMYGSGIGTGGVGGDTLTTKTPARHDFDELLRERREKVFNEYRTTSTTTYDLGSSPKASPVPPPRRISHGVVQLPSTLPPALSSQKSSSLYPPQIPNRSQSQNSKYNYDIEFNLNVNDRYYERDEVDNVDLMRRRTNTIDSAPQRQLQQQQQPQHYVQQQKQQLYQTRDIPLASPYVERNYHTISSSSASSTHAKNSNSNNYNRETLSPTSMLDIYSTPYDERSGATNKQRSNTMTMMTMQPLEATTATSKSTTTSTLQRTQRSTDYATYGNGNLYGHEHTNLGQTMTDRESSPIYATSTKKVTSSSLATAAASAPATPSYRHNNNNNNATISATSTTTMSVADYPSPTSQRPETPAFPVTPRTPFAGGSNGYAASQTNTLNTKQINGSYQQHHYLQQQQTQQLQQQQQHYQPAVEHNYSTETIYGTNYRPRLNSSLSMANSEPQEVAAHLVKFAKDSSKFWYKPNLSRDEAISLLINANPGTFVVRDSTTYKNAYGLVLRVSQPPPGSTATGKPDELVRHFLIEPTTRGVRLKGCANEPVFTSLSALVYEHSINQLALPCLLHIPERDLVPPLVEHTPAQKQLLTQGAACNVLWLFSCDTESLTGEEAIRKAIRQMYALASPPTPTEVHFKVTQQGITLTDNTRKKFFRKHYTADIISFCAIDPDHRLWTMQEHGNDNTTVVGALKKTIFAFVARSSPSSKDNQCHIFCDLAINQPASAIVSFVNKTLPTEKQKNYVL
ncbi:tensin-1 [Calliphora vicina]|uniref:tensin-1 n=1 Tax=Calliphora vicina TaxID=7373 RepID=UPI00325A4F9F